MGQGYFEQDKKTKKWSVQFYYQDYYGNRKRKHKTGFSTKREATEFMDAFIKKQKSDISMTFEAFLEEYEKNAYTDLRDSTISTKNHILELHVLPFFRNMGMCDISALDIKRWQNEMKKKGFSDTYLYTINAQLSAVFNYAVRFYHLSYNPCKEAGNMGKSKSGNMGIWSQEEMEQFLEAVKDKPEIYYAFLLIYWTGIRVGELLALQIKDIDFEKKTLTISKSLNRVHREDVISPPKTACGNRVIYLPEFVLAKMSEYMEMLYGRTANDRLFTVTKSHLEKEIKRGAKLAGVKEIRIHDLRHSHASLLIANGVDIATVSNRLGHEKISTTLDKYGHMFDAKAKGVADKLDALNSSYTEE